MSSQVNSLAVLLTMLVSSACWAQGVNVNSKIRVIDGEAFYVHSVLGGQTLETIVSAYFTEVSLIQKYNPGLSEPLSSGAQIKVPYSDESLEAMSKRTKYVVPKKAPTYIKKGTSKAEGKKYSNQLDKPFFRPIPGPRERPTTMEEAADLLILPDDNFDKPVEKNRGQKDEINELEPLTQDDSEKVLADLETLSQSINESLESLAQIQEALEPTNVDPETGELIVPKEEKLSENMILASKFLENQAANYFDTTAANEFSLKEYFIVNINSDARIRNVKDERTVTNANSYFLTPDDLRGLRVDSLEKIQQILSIGFISEIGMYKYKVDIKKNTVKLEKTEGFRSQFLESSNHEEMILEAANNAGFKGAGEFIIMDGYREAASFKAFEYNPFGTKDRVIMYQKIVRIEQMNF